MTDPVTIRRATLADLPAWWELRLIGLRDHPEAFGSDYETSRQQGPNYEERGFFGDTGNALFAALTPDGRIVGQSATSRNAGKRSHVGEIVAVHVHADFRGQGIGEALVVAALDHLRVIPEITSIRISVTATNLGARRIYERLGFEVWGEEPDAIRTADGSCHNECHMFWREH